MFKQIRSITPLTKRYTHSNRSWTSLKSFHTTIYQQNAQEVYRAPTTRQLDANEKVLLLLGQEHQMQLTTSSSFRKRDDQQQQQQQQQEQDARNPRGNVVSTIVPYAIVPKERSKVIFERRDEKDVTYLQMTEEDKKNEKPLNHFEAFDIVFLVTKESEHNHALAPVVTLHENVTDKDGNKIVKKHVLDSEKQAEEIKMRLPKAYDMMMEEKVVSMMVGTSPDAVAMQQLYGVLGVLPPRTLLKAAVKQIRPHEVAFQRLWTEYFSKHPNVKVQMGKVNMFIMTDLQTAYHVGVDGEMTTVADSVASRQKLVQETNADPLASVAKKMIARLNNDRELLHTLITKVYHLDHIQECFVFSLHRFGMCLMGTNTAVDMENPADARKAEWQEYFLDYGFEITTEEKLMDYLSETHRL